MIEVMKNGFKISWNIISQYYLENVTLLWSSLGFVVVSSVLLAWGDYTFGFGSRFRDKNKIKDWYTRVYQGIPRYIHNHTGLMFKSKSKAAQITFEFDKPILTPIHSWFVFFPFKATWYSDGKVIDEKIIMPWVNSYKPKIPFNKLVEVPII